MRQYRETLLYALVKGYEMNVGKVVEESILYYVEGKFSRNIPYPSFIIFLCIKGGVKFNEEEEERCPKASPLTLAGILKAPMERKDKEKKEGRKRRA